MKKWVLYHIQSGHIEYFNSETDAINERLKMYKEYTEEFPDFNYDKFCEWWPVEQALQ